MALAAAEALLAAKAKPPGALGGLEVWAARLAALRCRGDDAPALITDASAAAACEVAAPRLLVFAGDHGALAAEPGLSAFPRSVTAAMFAAVAGGGAACAVLAAANGVGVTLVDVGVDADVTSARAAGGVRVLHRKVLAALGFVQAGPGIRLSQQWRGGNQKSASLCALR